jgi:hypothetical protein
MVPRNTDRDYNYIILAAPTSLISLKLTSLALQIGTGIFDPVSVFSAAFSCHGLTSGCALHQVQGPALYKSATEVRSRRPRLVLGWVAAREDRAL